jgi:hypothetical protein
MFVPKRYFSMFINQKSHHQIGARKFREKEMLLKKKPLEILP